MEGARALPLRSLQLDADLRDAARRLLTLTMTRTVALRSLALVVDDLVEAGTQLELDLPLSRQGEGAGGRGRTGEKPGDEKKILQASLDRIHARWGATGIRRGVVAGSLQVA